MENSFDDRYGQGELDDGIRDGVDHGFGGFMNASDDDTMDTMNSMEVEGNGAYLSPDIDGDGFETSTSSYYISDLDSDNSNDLSHLATDDDFPNPNDALEHATLFSSATGEMLGSSISAKHSQMDEGIMKDMSSMLAHDLVSGMMMDGAKEDSNLMNACLLHGGLEFESRQELEETMENLVDQGLIVHSEGDTYRCNLETDDSNNVLGSQDEGESILLHRNAVLFPAMHCSEDLLDKVIELASKTCSESYIKFVHIAEDTTIAAELTNGNETVYHDDLESIVAFLEIDDLELANLANSELQNDDDLSLKIYDALVEWLNLNSDED